jgi:hypothetical protein
MWHWVMLKVWIRVRLIQPIYIDLQTRKKLDMWECCRRRNNKQGVFLFYWLRAHLIKLEIPLLFGETSFASIRLGVMLVALVVAANTRQPQSETERFFKKKKVCQSDRVSRNTGLAARWPKRNSNFPFLLYMFLSNFIECNSQLT